MDTYTTVKHLGEAGIKENHAAAIAYVVAQEHDNLVTKADIADFATKSDLKVEVTNLEKQIGEVNSNLQTQINDVKAELGKTEERMNTKIADVKTEVANSHREIAKQISVWVGGGTTFIVTAMALLLMYLPH